MPLIPALGRQMQVNLCESEGSLIFTVTSRVTQKEKEHLEKEVKLL